MVEFHDVEIISIDSIDYCTSHYTIVFLTESDTFHSIIEKDLKKELRGRIEGPRSEIFGISNVERSIMFKYEGEMYPCVINLKLKANLTHSSAEDCCTETSFVWYVRHKWWKKKIPFRIEISSFYIGNSSWSCPIIWAISPD